MRSVNFMNWICSTMTRDLDIFLICIKSSSNGVYNMTFCLFLITVDNNITRLESITVTTGPTLPQDSSSLKTIRSPVLWHHTLQEQANQINCL